MPENTYRKFTDEELKYISDISIVDYIQKQGYELEKMSKNEYKIHGYGGLIISEAENCWYCFGASQGGGLVQLMMFLKNQSWKEVIKEILGAPQNDIAVYDSSRSEKENVPLVSPEKNSSARNVIAYLCSTRKIDYDLVIQCIKNKLIYQDKKNNAVFVGYDKIGEIKHIHLKGTNPNKPFVKDVLGSDKAYSFSILGNTDTVFIYESPVDMLSYITLQKRLGYDICDNYLCLNGTSDIRLIQYLKDYPETSEIVLCLDNDQAGTHATDRIIGKLKSDYDIKVDVPAYKDFNEELIVRSELQHGFTEMAGEYEMEM